MAGEMITFKAQEENYPAYLAPASTGKGPAVIVIQEWWGLVGHIKNVTDRLATVGFTALAPDLYQGQISEEPDTAGQLMMALNINQTANILNGAIEFLLVNPYTSGEKVGVVGFCMGGQLALLAATLSDKVGACVDFYGIHPNVQPDFSKLSAPILGFFAEHDPYADQASVANLSSTLHKLNKNHEFITFPGTCHAFFNDDRPEVYDTKASEQAWKKMLEFLRQNL